MTNPCYRNDHHDMNSPLSGRPAGFRRNHSRNRTIVGYTNTVIIFRMHYVLHALCSCWTHACVNRKMMSGHDGVDDDIVFKSVDQLHRCDKYAGNIENRIHRHRHRTMWIGALHNAFHRGNLVYLYYGMFLAWSVPIMVCSCCHTMFSMWCVVITVGSYHTVFNYGVFYSRYDLMDR